MLSWTVTLAWGPLGCRHSPQGGWFCLQPQGTGRRNATTIQCPGSSQPSPAEGFLLHPLHPKTPLACWHCSCPLVNTIACKVWCQESPVFVSQGQWEHCVPLSTTINLPRGHFTQFHRTESAGKFLTFLGHLGSARDDRGTGFVSLDLEDIILFAGHGLITSIANLLVSLLCSQASICCPEDAWLPPPPERGPGTEARHAGGQAPAPHLSSQTYVHLFPTKHRSSGTHILGCCLTLISRLFAQKAEFSSLGSAQFSCCCSASLSSLPQLLLLLLSLSSFFVFLKLLVKTYSLT